MSFQREASSSSDDGEVDFSEQELRTLKTKIRRTREHRKSTREQMINDLEKQRRIIASLEADMVEMEKDFRLADSNKVKTADAVASEEMMDLQKMDAAVQEQLDLEGEHGDQLATEVVAVERKIREQHKTMGGIHKQQDKVIAIKKQIRVKENRLDMVTKEFGSMMAKNDILKQTIDHFQEERKTFETVKRRLRQKLDGLEAEAGGAIQDSAMAFEVKDEAQTKMKTLRERSEKEIQQFNQELRELMRSLDNAQDLKEFMAVKEQDRGKMLTTLDRKEAFDPEVEMVAKFEAALKQMKEATGIQDMDKLVARFMQVEDENFTLFNFINTHGGMLEDLVRSIDAVKADMESFRHQGAALDTERQKILAELEQEMQDYANKKDVHRQEIALYRRTLDELKSGIGSLFNKVDCDPTPINDMLGGQEGVTDASVLQYIGIVEERATELLQIQSYILGKQAEKDLEAVRERAEENDEDVEKAIARAKASMPPTMLLSTLPDMDIMPHGHIIPSSMDEPSLISSDSDTEDPVDLEFLRSKALKQLTKKEKARDTLRVKTPADSARPDSLA